MTKLKDKEISDYAQDLTIGRLYISRKEGGRGFASIEDSVEASIQRLEDYIKIKDSVNESLQCHNEYIKERTKD